ncbi:MAG TPA: SH3 domain-containing protein [Candidatus Saccharimonadales bacterium]|nr:SH3 domain-containing protein [Candidatus Saccharimonadales bacterium]
METAEQTTQPIKPSTPQPRKIPFQKIIYVSVFLLLILFIGVLVYIFFFKNQTEQKNSSAKVATKSATVSSSAKHSEVIYVTAPEGLNLRSEASTDSYIVTLLPQGTQLTVLTDSGDWYFVEGQTRGYVSKEFVTKEKPTGTILKTFKNSDSPFSFLYPAVYQVNFKKTEADLEYSFTGIDSYGGFTATATPGFTTLGNYALKNYPQGQRSACDVKFGTQTKECDKVVTTDGTIYLVLVNTTLYKITYQKTEGGLLVDLNNLVFYSMYFGD